MKNRQNHIQNKTLSLILLIYYIDFYLYFNNILNMSFKYILIRILFIPITLFGILLFNFIFTQLAPGGPIEQIIAKFNNHSVNSETHSSDTTHNQKFVEIQDNIRKNLEKQFHFDKPPYVRFIIMIRNYISFDLGKSFYSNKSVIQLIFEKLPVSISLGFFSTFIIYLISIPLGIKKSIQNGNTLDKISTFILIILYSIPAFVLAIFLIILFSGGNYFDFFPLRGLTSQNWKNLSPLMKIFDYLWHLVLPVLSMSIGGLASLTFLTKNSFTEEIHKNYCLLAKSKGLSNKTILYKHVFRNAMLIVISGFPALLIGMLFTGSILIEVIFSLDGIGLLGYQAIQTRDYPVIFGTLYLFSFIGLVLNLICDLTYALIDPRIHFNKREQ